jgi:hypothetical protein
LNGRYDWRAETLGITFVDPNHWIENWDFSRDGLHINRSVARRVSQLYSSLWLWRRRTEFEGVTAAEYQQRGNARKDAEDDYPRTSVASLADDKEGRSENDSDKEEERRGESDERVATRGA